jgi:hypothetical protein
MDEVKEIKVINPYERLKEIEGKLSVFEKEEAQLKTLIQRSVNTRNNKDRLREVESEIFYLIIEKEVYKNSINWFEIYYLGYMKSEELKSTIKQEKTK